MLFAHFDRFQIFIYNNYNIQCTRNVQTSLTTLSSRSLSGTSMIVMFKKYYISIKLHGYGKVALVYNMHTFNGYYIFGGKKNPITFRPFFFFYVYFYRNNIDCARIYTTKSARTNSQKM